MDAYEDGYGIAIDIGTTTVVTSLIELRTGEELADASMINAQKHYGLDVLTRITYEYENPETGIGELKDAIVQSINAMIAEVCLEASVDKEEIREIHVAAKLHDERICFSAWMPDPSEERRTNLHLRRPENWRQAR